MPGDRELPDLSLPMAAVEPWIDEVTELVRLL